ncbi:MAG: hypothetical protein RR547_09910 [Raoultibacter sp.]
MSPKPPKRKSIMVTTAEGSPVVEVFSMKTEGDKLVMDVKALDSMRMIVEVSTEAVAKGFSVVNKKEVFAFAKQLPKAMRAEKKKQAAEKIDKG